ncbi:MAG: NAD(P)/FAD-dependent oxidoreductase [Nitrospirae bacterium]|nr:NAD(P)/FAD-dependent oxidoreductase [Nitrospirota bacterium]
MKSSIPSVVIVGAGFGGLWASGRLKSAALQVTILDRQNYHTFFPLLYQVAAAEIEPEEIAYPVRSIRQKTSHARFFVAEVRRIDLQARRILTDGPELPYDYLILAPGSVPHFFGVPGAADFAFPLRTMDDGIELRNHILSCFERAVPIGGIQPVAGRLGHPSAVREPDPAESRSLLTFAIVGGGPTGVEFAGALAELIHGPFRTDYPSIQDGDPHVLLLEAANGLLPGQPANLARYAADRLRSRGVAVRLGAVVSKIDERGVGLKDGSFVPSRTVVWTAGVSGPPALEQWGLPMAKGGRVAVRPTLQVPDHPEVYVVGDCAHVEHEGRPLPGVAPVAMQEGEWAAENIRRQIAGEDPVPFMYRDLGTMAVIGRNAAVARIGKRSFTGFTAWVMWLVVHLMRLIGFRNRLVVLSSWAWDYFFFDRVVRLILPSTHRRDSARAFKPGSPGGAQET